MYKARCAELRALKKLERKMDADIAALKAENNALRSRAEVAEREAEVAIQRRTELQDVLDAQQARNEWGNPETFGPCTSEEVSSAAFGGFGRGRALAGRR